MSDDVRQATFALIGLSVVALVTGLIELYSSVFEPTVGRYVF